MRPGNDTPRDSCQGCLNATQRQLLGRVGDHFKERCKEAEPASERLRGALRGEG